MDSGSSGGRFNFRSTIINRVAVYIDGFNLYHAIDDLNYFFAKGRKNGLKPAGQRVQHLKWVDLWALSETLLRDYQTLVSVNYYSAYATWLNDEMLRHKAYTTALRAAGVNVNMGVFKERSNRCKGCKATWKSHEEKESDVRASVDLVADALLDKYDDAFLITADSDLKPGIERVKRETPKKNVVVIAPPGRWGHARGLQPSNAITKGRLAKCLFPREVKDKNGVLLVIRPTQYNPPQV